MTKSANAGLISSPRLSLSSTQPLLQNAFGRAAERRIPTFLLSVSAFNAAVIGGLGFLGERRKILNNARRSCDMLSDFKSVTIDLTSSSVSGSDCLTLFAATRVFAASKRF